MDVVSHVNLTKPPAGVTSYLVIETQSKYEVDTDEWSTRGSYVLNEIELDVIRYKGTGSNAVKLRARVYWNELLMLEFGPVGIVGDYQDYIFDLRSK